MYFRIYSNIVSSTSSSSRRSGERSRRPSSDGPLYWASDFQRSISVNLTLFDEIMLPVEIHNSVRRRMPSAWSERRTIRRTSIVGHVVPQPPVQQAVESSEEEITRLMEASFLDAQETNKAAPASRWAIQALKKTRISAGRGLGETCVICLDKFKAGVIATVMPCDHMFHRHCLDTWMKRKHSCPLCRLDLPRSGA